MLESCLRPDLVVEITMQPVRRYGVDAAILFSDIVLPVKAAGVDLDIKPGVGPVVASPIRDAAATSRALPALEPDHVAPVAEAVRGLVAELGATPLIGFAGAPFTLASYLVEGGPSRDHARTKALMYGDEDTWHALAGRLADIAATYPAGADRSGRQCGPALRLLGGLAVGGGLRALRVAAQPAGARSRWPTCRGSTSASTPASCSA